MLHRSLGQRFGLKVSWHPTAQLYENVLTHSSTNLTTTNQLEGFNCEEPPNKSRKKRHIYQDELHIEEMFNWPNNIGSEASQHQSHTHTHTYTCGPSGSVTAGKSKQLLQQQWASVKHTQQTKQQKQQRMKLINCFNKGASVCVAGMLMKQLMGFWDTHTHTHRLLWVVLLYTSVFRTLLNFILQTKWQTERIGRSQKRLRR